MCACACCFIFWDDLAVHLGKGVFVSLSGSLSFLFFLEVDRGVLSQALLR